MKYLQLFKKNPDFAYLTIGNLLSSIGVSFTMIATYALLESQGASPFMFSLAFVLETAPGALAAWLADKYFKRLNIAHALIAADFLGGLLLILPILGVLNGSLALLLVAGVIGSANVGFSVPYLKTHTRRVLQDDEVSVATFISTYTFAITFVVGTLLGTLLLKKVGALNFYLIDALSYFLSCVFTWVALKKRRANFVPQSEEYRAQSWRALYRSMKPDQKKSLMLNTLLIVNCSPAAAILPAISLKHSQEWQGWGVFLSLAMTFIVLKTVGQILGPLLVERFDLSKVIEKSWVVPLSLLAFQLIYCAIFYSESLALVMPMVVLAHIASNIVFMLGYYSMIRYFSESEIGTYSSFQHQISILVLVVSCLWSGWLGDKFGVQSVALVSLAIGLVTSISYLRFDKKQNVEVCRVVA